MPLVSFCVPTYGRAAFLGRTLSSALAQTVTDFEIVVVNDCSPDDTAEVVRRFTDPRIRYVLNEKNLGVPENLNRAMSFARGEYLVLLEDHDLLEPDYLEETLGVMRRHPAVGFVATGCISIDEQDHPHERYVERFPEVLPGMRLLRRILTRTDCPFTVTTLIRKSALEGIEPLFDGKYWWYADLYLWLRLAAKSDFGYVARPLLNIRTREADHFLVDSNWESSLCVDRIHRDNWRLLHPRHSLVSRLDWTFYEKSKLWSAAAMRAGCMLRNEPWTEKDEECAAAFLAPWGQVVLGLWGKVPLRVVAWVRACYVSHLRNRTKLEAGANDSVSILEKK